MSMDRYNVITEKNPREILLLKSTPCRWGKCSFCDYIDDNTVDEDEIIITNKKLLSLVTGELEQLEIINSGSCFELPTETLKDIKAVVEEKRIKTLYFESHYMYRNRLDEIRDFFDAEIVFKCGIETFDASFRNDILKKNIRFDSAEEVANHFSSICLMVGIQGQTKEMIREDVRLAEQFFDRVCINMYVNNTTSIKRDKVLADWFEEEFAYLEEKPHIEVLWHNTDFGVGGENE